jgi:hypothetical protein
VVGVALLAGPVRAQEQGEIVWITRPTTAQPPAGRVYGIAMSVRCTVRGGALTDCTAHPAEAPEGYAESAIVAAAHARVAAEDSRGVAVEGRVIEVPIGFPIPVAINPPPAPPGNVEGRLSGVVWLEQPDASDYVRLYPRRAWDENVSGRATVECIVGDTGRLTCELIAEDPLGYGFGEATIRASLLFANPNW